MSFITEEKKEMFKEEIARLEKIKVDAIKSREEKSRVPKLLKMMYSLKTNGEELPETETEKSFNNYYDATDNWLKVKLKAWNQILNYKKDKNMLDQINEAMDDWLQTAWVYFGQKDIEQQSRDAKDEYEVFKILLGQTPNKKTRRGGKKHKKKKTMPPKCAEECCDCFAAKNEYYPDSDGDEYWTLCEKCYEKDQE